MTLHGTDLAAQTVVHGRSAPESWWSTTNTSEAKPGVMTPLGWTAWGPPAEQSVRVAYHVVGALPKREIAVPDRSEDLILNVFYGRVSARVDFFCHIGDVMPGASAEDAAKALFSTVPEDLVSNPTRRRYPFIAVRRPLTFLRAPRASVKVRGETADWWRREIARTPTLDRQGALAQCLDAVRHLEHATIVTATTTLSVIQPIYQRVSLLAAKVGIDSGILMSGHGDHTESDVVLDTWALSRDRMSLDEFLNRHGYHGPHEGEVASRVWREDPSPLLQIVARYRERGDDADPGATEAERVQKRLRAERELLAALPARQRARARFLLAVCGKFFPLRGHGKAAYLQCIDVIRAAARRLGDLLAEEGIIDVPGDVFFLTLDDLRNPPPNAKELVAERRERHEYYKSVTVPSSWRGDPEPVALDTEVPDSDVICGIGVSPGVIEGRAVVVDDPAMADVEPGDLLVAHTTDPGWAPIMYLSSGLIVDIGGRLSHAAVVARELGVPCVMNTQVGTRALRTGDLVRLDGGTGEVTVLERAGRSAVTITTERDV